MADHVVTAVHLDVRMTTVCPKCGQEIIVIVHPTWPPEMPVGEAFDSVTALLAKQIERHAASHVN